MKPERWKQVEQLYHAALEREPGARDAFLSLASADDEELRREVEELLRYDGAAESFIKGDALAFEARRLDPEELSQTGPQFLPGQRIGAYKIFDCASAKPKIRNNVVRDKRRFHLMAFLHQKVPLLRLFLVFPVQV